MSDIKWGAQGEEVFRRTYARSLPDGRLEDWEDTVNRVVKGNLGLVYGAPETWSDKTIQESGDLYRMMLNFDIIPAGRHIWASGVPGQQYLFNCHVAGWTPRLADHIDFMMMRLMEGGGVGSNYSRRPAYPAPARPLNLHLVCSNEHADHAAMRASGVLSETYGDDWCGAFEVEDSREGWSSAVCDLVDTFYRGDVRHPHRVYDLAHVRPAGARLKRFGGTASGPLPLARLLHKVAGVLNRAAQWQRPLSGLDLMDIDHAIGEAVVAGGVRRSARMSIMKYDDPEVMEFIRCKTDTDRHWTSNISVEIDNRFIAKLGDPGSHESRVFAAVVAGMHLNGEPGLWNSELSQKGEPGTVVCTNPCGEICLEEWEACNLGHVNMENFAGREADLFPALRLMTRFLIRATFGDIADPKQRAVQDRNRRIGVGLMGIQGYLVKSGLHYWQAPERSSWRGLLAQMQEQVEETARRYAFQLRIPEPVKTTTIAPTGTVAKLPGVTEGAHPVFATHFIRRMRFSKTNPDQALRLEELAALGYHIEDCLYAADTAVVSFPTKERLVDEAPGLVESVDQLSVHDQLGFQAALQQCWANNAVSYTVSIDPEKVSARILSAALQWWLPTLKGTTVFPEATRPQSPYERITAEEYARLTGPKEVGDGTDENCANGSCPIR